VIRMRYSEMSSLRVLFLVTWHDNLDRLLKPRSRRVRYRSWQLFNTAFYVVSYKSSEKSMPTWSLLFGKGYGVSEGLRRW
jgi:hypothetical protein